MTLSLRSAIQKGKEDVNTTLKNEGGEIVRGEKESGSAVVGAVALWTGYASYCLGSPLAGVCLILSG